MNGLKEDVDGSLGRKQRRAMTIYFGDGGDSFISASGAGHEGRKEGRTDWLGGLIDSIAHLGHGRDFVWAMARLYGVKGSYVKILGRRS